MKTIELTYNIYDRLNQITDANQTHSEAIAELFHSIGLLGSQNEELVKMLDFARDTIEKQTDSFKEALEIAKRIEKGMEKKDEQAPV